MIRAFQAPWTGVERIGLLVGLALSAAMIVPVAGHVTDDTFTHLQYARHLAEGRGLVFNVGERVYGCTSPLWVALVADGIAFGLDGLQVARALGIAATLASVALVLQLLRRTLQRPELRALGTVAWASHPWMIQWSASGLETPLAVALTLAGFVAFTEGKVWGSRPVRTGALWGMAALTRPEGVFLITLWASTLIIDAQNRAGLRRMVFGLFPVVAIYGAWLLFVRFYYGSFWPQELAREAVAGAPMPMLDGLWRQARIAIGSDGALLALMLIAAVAGARQRSRADRSAQRALPVVWLICLPILYAGRGTLASSRHLLLVLPVIGWWAWRLAERWWLGEGTPGRVRATVAGGVIVTALVLAQNLALYRTTVVPSVVTSSESLEQSLVQWGKWFGAHAPPDALIASPQVGAIGYWSRRRMLDVGGRLSPGMIPILERESPGQAVARLHFPAGAWPSFVVDRAAHAYDLTRRSRYASCFVPLGHQSGPGSDGGRDRVFSFYRLDREHCATP